MRFSVNTSSERKYKYILITVAKDTIKTNICSAVCATGRANMARKGDFKMNYSSRIYSDGANFIANAAHTSAKIFTRKKQEKSDMDFFFDEVYQVAYIKFSVNAGEHERIYPLPV